MQQQQLTAYVTLSAALPPLTPGLDHARLFLKNLIQLAVHPALKTLITRSEDDIGRAFICLMSDDTAGVNDICRDLMEIEILLADFHRDIRSLKRWSTLPTRQRSDEYKFGKLLDRVGTSAGVPQGMTHPMAAEYQAHSAGLHPTPEGRVQGVCDDLQTRLSVLGSDLIEHVWRVIEILVKLLSKHETLLEGESATPKGDLRHLVAARDAGRAVVDWMKSAGEQAGLEITDREPYSRKEHPEGALYRFRAAERE